MALLLCVFVGKAIMESLPNESELVHARHTGKSIRTTGYQIIKKIINTTDI